MTTMSTFFDDITQERRQIMTRHYGLASGVAAQKPKPAKFPPEYGAYLEQCAERAGLNRHEIAKRANLSYQAVYRNFEGKDERSLLAAAAIREVLIKAGVEVAAVPSGNGPWSPPQDVKPMLSKEAEVFRRNLVRFREEAGYGDLHEGARVTGIPFETMRAYELGEREVSGAHLLELARVYGRDALHFEMETPPAPKRAPRLAQLRIIAPLEELSPENRARVEALQRETAELNRALNAETASKKPKRP